MPTYVYRCEKCKTDWQRLFKMADKPGWIKCPECDAKARSVVTALPVIFKSSGFPGNDMKHLETGKSAGTKGLKPTHKDMVYIEKVYPNVHDSSKAKEVMDKARSGSKTDNFGRR